MTSVPTPVSQSRPPSRLKLSSLRREQNSRCCATRWIEPACCATEYRKRRSAHERGPLAVTRQTECRYMGRLYQRRLPSGGEWEDLPHVQSGQWRNHRLSRESDEEDVEAAVRAALAAFPAWKRRPGAARAKLLIKLAQLVEANAAKLAELESLNAGKPIRDSKA